MLEKAVSAQAEMPPVGGWAGMTGQPVLPASAGGQPGGSRPGRASLDSLPQDLGGDAERLLIGISVYREPADRNAVLFQVGQHDWTAARAPDRRGPAPPYQAPADLNETLAACEAAGMFMVTAGSAGAGAADGHTVFVEPWVASQLHRLLAAAGRGAELTYAHQRAAEYWQWRSAAWPQGRRADIHDLLEARHHLFDAGDTEQASIITEAVCTQLHAWGDLGRESALIHETLDRLPARSSRRAAWIYELGRIAAVKGDHADAELRYQQALDMFADVGDRAGVSRSHHSLGVLAQAQGNYARAERRYQQSSDAAERPAAGGTAAAPSAKMPADIVPAAAVPPAAAQGAPAQGAPAPHPPAAADPAAAAHPAAADAPAVMAFSPPASSRPASAGPRTAADLRAAASHTTASHTTASHATASHATAGQQLPAGAASRPPMTPVILPRHAARSAAAPQPAPTHPPPTGAARQPEPTGAARRERPQRWAAGWRLPCLTAVALILATLSAVEISGVFSTASGARLMSESSVGNAGAVRREAAIWVEHQVARSAVIACDPAMCSELQAQGAPAGSLLALGPGGSADPLGSNVVMATAAVRSLFGPRLAGIYAPVVVARFGTGGALIEVRVVAPDGSAAYLRALKSDQQARREAGAQLLLNNRIRVTAAARSQLGGGLVDSRLLTALAALAQMHPLRIISFASAGQGASVGVPLPIVVLTGAGHSKSAAYLRVMLAFLRAQRPPFLPASEQPERLSNGQEALRIEFADPSPLGLLTAGDTALPPTTHP